MFTSVKKFFGIDEKSDEVLYNKLISVLKKLTHAIQATDKDKKEVEKLIDKIKNNNLFNQSDENGNTALILAADAGLEKACLKLIPKMTLKGINTIENIRGQPALVKAIWRDLDNVCVELIPLTSKGDHINAIDNCRRTLLMLAAKKGMTTVSKMFINLMPPEMIIHVDNEGNTAASYASTDKAFAETMNLLQEKLLKNLASFLNKAFLNEDGLDNFVKIACITKFYKKLKVKVNKELLEPYLQKQNNNPESIIITMDNFMKSFPFAIAGVCKKIQPDSKTSSLHLSCLPNEAICCIISHLENEKWGVDVKSLGAINQSAN